MKKYLSILLVMLLAVCLFGCNSQTDPKQVAEAISDITSDSDGNVVIALADGRKFTLGNLKGENGKDGKDGEDGGIAENCITTIAFEGDKLTSADASGNKKYIGSAYTHGQFYYQVDCVAYIDNDDKGPEKTVIASYYGYANKGEKVTVKIDEIISFDGNLYETESGSTKVSFTMVGQDLLKEVKCVEHTCDYKPVSIVDYKSFETNFIDLNGFEVEIIVPMFKFECACGDCYEDYLINNKQHCEHHNYAYRTEYLEGKEKCMHICECGQYYIDDVDLDEVVTFTIDKDLDFFNTVHIILYGWDEYIADATHPAGTLEVYDENGDIYQVGQVCSFTRGELLDKMFSVNSYVSKESRFNYDVSVVSPQPSVGPWDDAYEYDDKIQLKLTVSDGLVPQNVFWHIDWQGAEAFATITQDGLLELHKNLGFDKIYNSKGKFVDEDGRYDRKYYESCEVGVSCDFILYIDGEEMHCGHYATYTFGESTDEFFSD